MDHFIAWFCIGIAAFLFGAFLASSHHEVINKRLIETNNATYVKGEFVITNPDIKYILTGKQD